MPEKVGIASGYHEQRQHGWPRKSRIWNGDAWVTEEEFKNDRRINPKTGDLKKGTRLFEAGKDVFNKTRETLTGVYDTIGSVLPENNIASVAFDEAETLSKGLLSTAASTVVSAYGKLPEDIRENVQAGGSALAQTLEDSSEGWSQQLDLHPFFSDFAVAALETALTSGIGPTSRLLGNTSKMVNAVSRTQGNKLVLSSIDNVVQPGLMKGYTQDVLSGNPLAINIETPFTRMRPGMTTREAIEIIGDTSNYKKLKKKYKYLTPEQIVNDPNLIRRLKTKEAELVALNKKVESFKSKKDLLLENYPDSKIRPKNISNELKQLDKNISKYSKELTDVAGGNPLLEGVENRQIYGNKTIRTYLKKNFPEFDDNLNRWHHKHGSADIGKSHLTDLTQDPWIKVNLYAHMKKNKIFSSGTVNNLVLIKEFPHNEWHKYAKSMKLEPEYFISSMQRWVNSDLTFFQYIEDISKEVIAGNADINELFTIVEAYGKAQKKINAKLFTPEFAGKNFSDVTGIVEKLGETSIQPTLIKKQAIQSVSEN